MNIDLLQAGFFRKLHERIEMRVVGVHAAIGKQAHQVQRAVVLFAVFDGAEKRFVPKKISVRDCLGDTRKLLVDDTPCANIEVTYLAVAHLARWQADIHTARRNLRMRIFVPKTRNIRRAVCLDGVEVLFLGAAEAIQND
ncbi:hypothetical protein SDC9_122855 [bioreactor metagenome]|uniref:Uncharacterized protein n=1 Tax=bioreactor metagenome TaxID=1076179 RepID=A0A645CG32_9ZZZZ